MVCRVHRLLIAGLIGASAATAATLANAGELTAEQLRTIAMPKRSDTAAPRANLTALPANLAPFTAGDGLKAHAPTTATPLTGLSLDNLSLAAPLTSGPSATASDPTITQRNGNIRYNVIPDASFTPYVGLGAGRATGLLNAGLSHPSPYDIDNLHAYQGQAGFAYKLDKDTSLDFDYRMSNTQRPNVPMLDNANIADTGRDRAAILSLHYTLDPVLRKPPE